MEWSASQIEDLDSIATEFLNKFKGQKLFAFYGKMGVGKTTFVKALCSSLEVTDSVNSPTFSLVNEYLTSKGETIYHFDFYRINDLNEAYDIGFEEYLQSGNYCFVEWPEKIQDLIDDQFKEVHLIENNGVRLIQV